MMDARLAAKIKCPTLECSLSIHRGLNYNQDLPLLNGRRVEAMRLPVSIHATEGL
jgi:hypothetical protein